MRKFAAITYCIGYADFLKHTLPLNKQLFDKVIVVTDESDLETQAVCAFNDVQCIATNEVYEKDAKYPNKGLGVNIGLKEVPEGWWAVQLDADICFTQPHVIKKILSMYPLQDDFIYGIDRMDVNGWDAWVKHFHLETRPTHSRECMVDMSLFRFNHRFIIYNWNVGYCPIGYFQMWKPSVVNPQYPVHDGAAVDHSDVQHAKNFPREKRHLIPDFYAFHLMSGNDEMGANWYGRKTKRFGPDIPFEQTFEVKKKTAPAERGTST